MKFYTHPQLNLSIIQTKDGALYTKRWMFFRSTLSLEIDLTSHPLWQRSDLKVGNNSEILTIKDLIKNLYTKKK